MPRARMLLVAAALVGCGPPARDTGPDAPPPLGPIVATQLSPSGGTLVFIGEGGATVADFVEPGLDRSVDLSPAWSPDGKWIAFASSRGRSPDEYSLWIAAAEPRAQARRLTVDRTEVNHPTFGPDSTWLVYAVRTDDGSYDLFRAPLRLREGIPSLGTPTRLTDEPGSELRPSVSPDGGSIVFMQVDAEGRSRLRIVPAAGGAPRDLTEGPVDVTPAWSPDGRTIAFATRPGNRLDTDLYLLDLDSGERRVAVYEPLADQTAPVWSTDGRYVACTSTFRSAETGAPLAYMVTAVDLRQAEPVLIALQDPSAIVDRFGPAVAPRILDATAMNGNPTYGDALAEVGQKILRQRPELVDDME